MPDAEREGLQQALQQVQWSRPGCPLQVFPFPALLLSPVAVHNPHVNLRPSVGGTTHACTSLPRVLRVFGSCVPRSSLQPCRCTSLRHSVG